MPSRRCFSPTGFRPWQNSLSWPLYDAAERLLLPAIERDIRGGLTEKADLHAIQVFATNLRALLGQPPLAGHTVLGIDPGFRTGCKVAVVDPTGKLLDTATIYPHEPQRERQRALKILAALIQKHRVSLISIGNGTASRETEGLAAELIQTAAPQVKYLITNEAGASVYSASPLARAEMPDLDVSIRGAVSIARRIQDPLAELVKIDPKSIGVGLYQHDVDQKQLSESLTGVVESVVNQVGVDVSTASPCPADLRGRDWTETGGEDRGIPGPERLLRRPGGAAPVCRGWDRRLLNNPQAFCASEMGKTRWMPAPSIQKATPWQRRCSRKPGCSSNPSAQERKPALEALLKRQPVEKLAAELGTGVPTLTDIFEQLIRPGRDPRQDTPAPILRSDVLSMEDLREGMRMKGTVRNVVDFGAFIDIGVKQDGLLHRSQVPPGTLLKVGDIIEVEIQKIEIERGRIGLGWPASK